MALMISIVCTPKAGRTRELETVMTDLHASLTANRPEGMQSAAIWRCETPPGAMLVQAVWEAPERHAAYRAEPPGRDLFARLVDVAELTSVTRAPLDDVRVISWE